MNSVINIASNLGVALLTAIQSSGPRPSGALGCLGLLLLPLLAFLILRVRSLLKQSGKGQPGFTSLRSTGKTIVNAAPDDDDTDQFGGVN